MFKKYIFTVSVWISLILWCVIFITGSLFFVAKYTKNQIYQQKILKQAKEKVLEFKNKRLDRILNNLAINQVIENTLNGNQQDNDKIKKIFIVPYISAFNQNKEIIFSNFNIKQCGKSFSCTKLNKDKLLIFLAVKNNYNYEIFINQIKHFALISFLIAILLFLPIKILIEKLHKPIEENYEFMKSFVNNAGHELKTPITNINLSAQILAQKKKFDPEIVNDLISETNKITAIINSLLELASIKQSQKEKVNLENLIKETLNELKAKDFKIHLALKNKEIIANPNQLKILLKNLLENAIKYSTKNEIFINFDGKEMKIGNYGKEIKNPSKIFELFYKEDKSKKGFGLGLALVKKIVETNNWKIKIKRENGINWFIIGSGK